MSTIFYGFAAGFVGYLPPSMINMSIVGISVKNSMKAGILFSLGALLVGGVQEWFSLACSDVIVENEGIMKVLEDSAVFVLLALGGFFLYKGFKERKKAEGNINQSLKNNRHDYFFRGIFTSVVNFLAIPYWLVIGTVFAGKGWLVFEKTSLNYFILGGILGMMTLFMGYVLLSRLLAKKMSSVSRNMNFILGGIFLLLGVVQLFRLLA